MLITLKSSSSGDVIMLEPSGKQVLELMGKDVSVSQGIITIDQLPGAIAALKLAAQADEATAAGSNANHGIRLFQRAPPILELLERSLKDKAPVTWGT